MSSKDQNLSAHDPTKIPSGKDKRFGIVVSEWNEKITNALLQACVDTLVENAGSEEEIDLLYVPGSFELPLGAKKLLDGGIAEEKPYDAVIILGAVITGETKHDEYICNAVSHGVMDLNLTFNTPVIFGLLTPRNMEQALDRAGGKRGNKGVEAAVTALKMAAL